MRPQAVLTAGMEAAEADESWSTGQWAAVSRDLQLQPLWRMSHDLQLQPLWRILMEASHDLQLQSLWRTPTATATPVEKPC